MYNRNIGKFLIVAVLAWCVCMQACGQQGMKVTFEPGEWNFGRINETDGPVTHTFIIANKGSRDIVIEKVRTSCGCTATTYDREPVKPRKSAKIEVRLDPKDFSGEVRKSFTVTVTDGAEQFVQQLWVVADVNPRPLTMEEEFPYALEGGLRASELHFPFMYVHAGQTVSDTLTLINTSPREIALGLNSDAGTGFLKVFMPRSIGPGKRAQVVVTYDMDTAEGIYGMVSDRAFLTINGRQASLPINTNAILVDDFSGVDEDSAPRSILIPSFRNFGEVKAGETVSAEAVLRNAGAAPLIVRAVSVRRNTECTLEVGTVIAPGEEIAFTVRMKAPSGTAGVVSGGVSIVTNDPVRPMRDFRTAADVVN